jgi:ribosomal protein S18 acetylase RimI-like enzyme
LRLRSLGYRTDLIFVRFDGKVTDRGEYLRVESPSNPTYYWGNFLLFARPPDLGDFARWQRLFREEFAHAPLVRHLALGWDSPEGELGFVQPFVGAGFELQQGVVLKGDPRSLRQPARPNHQILVRPLATDQEWLTALDNGVMTRPEGYEEKAFRDYLKERMGRLRLMSEKGLGYWFGAFLGDRLVADLGIYRDGDLGRFQNVGTHPEFRNQGICGTLVYEASQYAFEKMQLKDLVIIADEGGPAARIYESVGFGLAEKVLGLQRRA